MRAALLAAAAATFGCTATRSAEPAASATASVRAAGVDVSAALLTHASHASGVWVSLNNDSGRPLRVDRRQMHLEGTSGAKYTAVISYGAWRAADPAFVTPLASSVMAEPAFEGDRTFVLAPKLSYDPSFRRSPEIELPHRAHGESMLPEGLLRDGGRISGSVYFDGAAADEPSLALVVDLIDADGDPLGQVRLPLQQWVR